MYCEESFAARGLAINGQCKCSFRVQVGQTISRSSKTNEDILTVRSMCRSNLARSGRLYWHAWVDLSMCLSE